jgi:hypothetical protein
MEEEKITITDIYPALRRLGLSDPELLALRRQGYLERDPRGGRGAGYWRLRFRDHGSLRTIYVGNDSEWVACVRAELLRLQAARRRRLALQRELRLAKQGIRTAKQRLAPLLNQVGYHYHGHTIRKFAISPLPSSD